MQNNPTIAAYDKYAPVYDEEVIEFWQNFPREFINKFIASLPGKRVLNLGSGSGRDALLLQDYGLDIVCIDASGEMVAITKKLGFESHKVAFSELSFPKESFDGIWAYTSLIHIPKSEAKDVIKNIHSILNPNGSFVIGAIEGSTEGMVERKTMPNAARYFKNYTAEELKNLIKPIGFELIYEQDYQPHNNIYLNQLYKKK